MLDLGRLWDRTQGQWCVDQKCGVRPSNCRAAKLSIQPPEVQYSPAWELRTSRHVTGVWVTENFAGPLLHYIRLTRSLRCELVLRRIKLGKISIGGLEVGFGSCGKSHKFPCERDDSTVPNLRYLLPRVLFPADTTCAATPDM